MRAVGRDDVAFLDIWPLTKQVAHAWSLDGTHFADEVKHEENRLVLAALKLMSAKRRVSRTFTLPGRRALSSGSPAAMCSGSALSG